MAHRLLLAVALAPLLMLGSNALPLSSSSAALLTARDSNKTSLLSSKQTKYSCPANSPPDALPQVTDCMSAISTLPLDDLKATWFGLDFPFQVTRGQCKLTITAGNAGSDVTSFLELRMAAFQLSDACTRNGVITTGHVGSWMLTPGTTSGSVNGLGEEGHIVLTLAHEVGTAANVTAASDIYTRNPETQSET